jgi:uncharacterized membrane protein (UPF0127 family)
MATEWRQLREAETGRVIVPRLEMATSLRQQTFGLIGRKTLPQDYGLWLEPCNGIHTFLMRVPLDVLFLDKKGYVLRAVPNLRPWRICGPVRKAAVVVELPAGTITARKVRVGALYIPVNTS